MYQTRGKPSRIPHNVVYYNERTRVCAPTRQSPNDLRFDSEFEFSIWRAIRQWLPNGATLELHKPMLILPSSLTYPPIYWKVDFYIPPFDNGHLSFQQPLLIEAKGKATDDFLLQMKLFAFFQPQHMKRLHIITNREQKYTGLQCATLKDLPRILATSNQLP